MTQEPGKRPALSPTLIAVVAAAAGVLGAIGGGMMSGSRIAEAPLAPHVAVGSAAALEATTEPVGAPFDVLAAGNTSPRGASAAGLPLEKILKNATGSAPEGEQGASWRKRNVAAALAGC